MSDVALWALLRQPRPPADDLATLLTEMAGRPAAERAPFFGLLSGPLRHADPAVRAAAQSLLAGARGLPGLQAIVQGLSDPVETVRSAAVEALRAALMDGDAPRWAHALFHPDAAVRRAA